MRRMLRNLRRRLKRTARSPFVDRGTRTLLVCCSHHKAGTSWFHHVLSAVARWYGLRYEMCTQEELSPAADVFFEDHSRINRSTLSPYRGAHLIRDPRDIVVSGYFYHLWTTEEWVHTVKPEFGNRSYLEHLNSLSQEEGLLVEMKRFADDDLPDMVEWDYHDPNFIEVRYEDLIADWTSEFRRTFRHYGFTPKAIEKSLRLAQPFSFENQAGRKIGEVQAKSHLRSGRAGQWMDVFGDRHRRLGKELLGAALIRLGYEASLDW
jgi:Sulfotransferase domain